jgi:hypothetical protein
MFTYTDFSKMLIQYFKFFGGLSCHVTFVVHTFDVPVLCSDVLY